MCGIVGLWSERLAPRAAELHSMAAALRHRGPDDHGVWQDVAAGIGLAHRRLSILDLSNAGHQPMASPHGRYVLVFNGEIYNFAALRQSLEQAGGARIWKGHSDTEILLAGFEQWGVRATLERANGMFAIGVWDRVERTLALARDRMGEKPLYFTWVGGRFAFASETKAFGALEGWRPRLEPDAVAGYLRTGYAAGPQALIAGVFRLPPGSLLTLGRDALAQPICWDRIEARLERYWSLACVVRAARARQPLKTHEEYFEGLESLIADSVRLRMVADVPVGALLSGGIDSTTVVALAQAVSPTPIRTFTAGFEDAALDEAPHAARIAKHLGTEHTELYVHSGDALELIPRLPDIYDEPFADSSQIPTTLIAGMASRHVKVALSGDGGDELFAGYSRYALGQEIWRWMGRLPAATRRGVAGLAYALAALGTPLDLLWPGRDATAFRIRRLAWRASALNVDALRHTLMCAPPLGAKVPSVPPPASHAVPPVWLHDAIDRMMYADQADYLPDDILVKLDRASMHWSLESRIPLLDHRLVEFTWSLPRPLVFDRNGGKPLLKRLLAKHVPPALTERPKKGFDVPLAAWLRGPLRPWAESLLVRERLEALGGLDVAGVESAWHAHLTGRANAASRLWNVLMLLAWGERSGDSA